MPRATHVTTQPSTEARSIAPKILAAEQYSMPVPSHVQVGMAIGQEAATELNSKDYATVAMGRNVHRG